MLNTLQSNFDVQQVKAVEREVFEAYVWELREKCRQERTWGTGMTFMLMLSVFMYFVFISTQVPDQIHVKNYER